MRRLAVFVEYDGAGTLRLHAVRAPTVQAAIEDPWRLTQQTVLSPAPAAPRRRACVGPSRARRLDRSAPADRIVPAYRLLPRDIVVRDAVDVPAEFTRSRARLPRLCYVLWPVRPSALLSAMRIMSPNARCRRDEAASRRLSVRTTSPLPVSGTETTTTECFVAPSNEPARRDGGRSRGPQTASCVRWYAGSWGRFCFWGRRFAAGGRPRFEPLATA